MRLELGCNRGGRVVLAKTGQRAGEARGRPAGGGRGPAGYAISRAASRLGGHTGRRDPAGRACDVLHPHPPPCLPLHVAASLLHPSPSSRLSSDAAGASEGAPLLSHLLAVS